MAAKMANFCSKKNILYVGYCTLHCHFRLIEVVSCAVLFMLLDFACDLSFNVKFKGKSRILTNRSIGPYMLLVEVLDVLLAYSAIYSVGTGFQKISSVYQLDSQTDMRWYSYL